MTRESNQIGKSRAALAHKMGSNSAHNSAVIGHQVGSKSANNSQKLVECSFFHTQN